MRYLSIGGIPPVSAIGLGMAAASPAQADAVFAVLDTFVAAGGTLVDTAHSYGNGAADRTLGMWLARRDRASLVILAKGGHPLADGAPRVSPEHLRSDLLESLERLGTDHVDLFVLHRDDPSVPVARLLEATQALREAGWARAFGVSNWSIERLREANDYAASHGLTPFAVNSPGMSLASAREPMWPGCVYADGAARAWHAAAGLPAVAWSAQARGFFSGRHARDAIDDPELRRVYGCDANFDRLERATALARERGVTPNQVALAYLLAQPFPLAALVAARNAAQLHDSLGALRVQLSAADVRWLESG